MTPTTSTENAKDAADAARRVSPDALTTAQSEVQLETAISGWLTAGLAMAVLLVVAGWLVVLVQHPAGVIRLEPLSLSQLPGGIRHGQGAAIILLGLTVLTLTPVIRVLITFLHYGRNREWSFVLITGFVLAAMIIGFFVGAAG